MNNNNPNLKYIRDQKGQVCCVEKLFNVLNGKWSFLIIKNLFGGTKRFGELRTLLNDVSPKTLTVRLRELESYGIIKRKVYPVIPPAVEYTLTEKGEALIPIFSEMQNWVMKWEPQDA